MTLTLLGERMRKRHKSCLVFQGGEEGTQGVVTSQEGCNEESFSPSEGFRLEFWRARN